MPTDLHSIINRSLVVVVVTQRKNRLRLIGAWRVRPIWGDVSMGARRHHTSQNGEAAARPFFLIFFILAVPPRTVKTKRGKKRIEQNGPTTKLFRPRPLIGFPGKCVRQKIIYFFFQPTDWIERTKKGNKNEIDPAHPTRM